MQILFLNQVWKDLQIPLIVFAIGIVIYWLFNWLFKHILKQKNIFLFKDSQDESLKLFAKYWKEPLIISSILIVLYTILCIVLPNSIKNSGGYRQITLILTISLFTWLAIQAVRTTKDVIINVSYWHHHTNIDIRRINTQMSMLTKIIIVVLMVIGISLILMTFPQIWQIGVSILASAGITGIILGLAAQKILGNILIGVQVAFTQPIKVGDEIVIENEIGAIEEVNLTYVVVRTLDKRQLIIPINYFIEKIFQNWTRNSSDLLSIVHIEVDYTVSIQKMREFLDLTLQETSLWDKKAKELQVTNIKAKTIELRILASASNSTDVWNLQCYIREKLVKFLQSNLAVS